MTPNVSRASPSRFGTPARARILIKASAGSEWVAMRRRDRRERATGHRHSLWLLPAVLLPQVRNVGTAARPVEALVIGAIAGGLGARLGARRARKPFR